MNDIKDDEVSQEHQERHDEGGDLNTVQIVIAGGVVLLLVLIFSVYFMMQSPLN
jgi:hypothetical protein